MRHQARVKAACWNTQLQDHVKTDKRTPALSCLVSSCPVLSCPVLSCPVLSCPVLSCPVLSCPVLSCPVLRVAVRMCLP